MKKLIFWSWALIALLASGCSEDNLEEQDVSDVENNYTDNLRPLDIKVSGEANPLSIDIAFTFRIENAVSASYVIYDPERFSYEDIVQLDDFPLLQNGESLYGISFSMSNYIAPITVSLKALNECARKDVPPIFELINGSTYSIVVKAKNANGEEQIATATTTLWGYPYLILRPGWNIAVSNDELDRYDTEQTNYMCIGYYNCQEYCWIVTDDLNKYYTPNEIFEMADNIQPAKKMVCTLCDAIRIEIPRTENTQRVWVAIRNGDYYLTNYYTFGAIGHSDEDDEIREKNYNVLKPLN